MLSDEEFALLMDRARSGDAAAASELVSEYEPEIRRVARMRLTDSRLRRLVDSIDICQSVFGKFFEAAQSPKGMELQKPQQLLALLVRMTQNRVVDEYRHQTAQKRNAGDGVVEAVAGVVVSDSPGPGTEVELKDMFANIRSKLSDAESKVADLRGKGLSWNEIAEKIGGTADSHRKRLDRAIDRIRNEMSDGESID